MYGLARSRQEFRKKQTNLFENKQKPTPPAARSAYLLCHCSSRYQPSDDVLNFKTQLFFSPLILTL